MTDMANSMSDVDAASASAGADEDAEELDELTDEQLEQILNDTLLVTSSSSSCDLSLNGRCWGTLLFPRATSPIPPPFPPAAAGCAIQP